MFSISTMNIFTQTLQKVLEVKKTPLTGVSGMINSGGFEIGNNEEKKNLLITFSGGESSALMTIKLLTGYRHLFNTVKVVFCNTSQENEETLLFVKRVQEKYNFDVVWLEAVVHHGVRKSCGHRVVTFETASRGGEVFEEVIKKYGIPNIAYPHCTRALKLEPITSYLKSIGWKTGGYIRAIGIRSDEPRRLKEKDGVIYPLDSFDQVTKRDVNTFWADQEFRLNLTGYQGNCKTCWKKSLRKLMTVMDETPRSFDFFERMEEENGSTNTTGDFRRVFWRNNLTTSDLREIHKTSKHESAEDDSISYNEVQIGLDLDSGCVESCEAF